jgi:photosystem II stability/assembly factor-like uncharacterized protein
MRGPNDQEELLQEQLLAAPAVGRPVPTVPGGKALARLHQFEAERSIEPTDIGNAEAEKPLAQRLLTLPDSPLEGVVYDREVMRDQDEGNAYASSPYLTAVEERVAIEIEPATAPAPPTAGAIPVPAAWTPLGPFSIPHGQTYGSGPGSRPSVSGRVASIAIDPGNAMHILLGSAAGGVWESKDDGRTWSPRTDNQPTLTTGAIAFTPGNPAIAYAGTGEGNFYAQLGAGLLRSTDGGTTWSVRATAPFVGLGFYDLIVDPLNANHLLAATNGNLCESNDGGATWGIRRTQRVWDLSIHPAVAGNPNSTREVFAACADGLFRSTDGGTTWAAVALPGLPAGLARMAVCHAPSNGNIVYVFAAGAAGAVIWRRDVMGGVFSTIAPPAGLATNQAWYDWYAATAPNNPDILYLGAIDIHRGVRSGGTWTWTKISAKSSGDSVHPDQHAIAFSPTNPNVVYAGNDGGIYRSPDGGITWKSLNKGLSITEVEYMAQHPQYDAWMICGTQDNGTMRFEGGEIWPHVADGDGGDCGINNVSPYTCFHTYFGMGMDRSTSGGGWGTWSWTPPPVPSGYNALFYPPLEVNGSVIAQAGQSVFISTNNGTTWTNVALPSGVASALAIPTPTRVYAGTTGGNIYRIDQVGGIWTAPVALALPRAGYVSDILVDPTNPNRIWVTYSNVTGGHVYRSDNGGTSWNNMSAGLPNVPANAIVVDPANTNRTYVATDVGVYRSLDAGVSWSSYNNGMPNVIVGDLLFHPVSRLLRAGTRSRGVWEIAVDQGTMPDVQLYIRDSIVDTGRRIPSPTGGVDPFQPGGVANWADSTDIKVDSAPFQTGSLTDVDLEFFEDDHGVFAAGLQTEVAQGATRIFVQAHNRGPNPATNVAVKLFYADAATMPPLPAGFWTNFPNNVLPAGSPWKQVAPHKIVPSVAVGRPQIVGFDWNTPTNTSGAVWLLAVTSAGNDPVNTAELNIAPLVQNNPKCALKRVRVLPYVGVQWRGTVPANSTVRWFTFNWPANWHVIWTVMPLTPRPGGPEIRWKVQVERASAGFITYWISVTNLTPVPVDVEGRYCVLAIT